MSGHGTKWDRAEKDVLKEIFRVHFVPGRSGIEEFSRDIRSCCCPGTERHREKNFFCHGIKGQRDVLWKRYYKIVNL